MYIFQTLLWEPALLIKCQLLLQLALDHLSFVDTIPDNIVNSSESL